MAEAWLLHAGFRPRGPAAAPGRRRGRSCGHMPLAEEAWLAACGRDRRFAQSKRSIGWRSRTHAGAWHSGTRHDAEGRLPTCVDRNGCIHGVLQMQGDMAEVRLRRLNEGLSEDKNARPASRHVCSWRSAPSYWVDADLLELLKTGGERSTPTWDATAIATGKQLVRTTILGCAHYQQNNLAAAERISRPSCGAPQAAYRFTFAPERLRLGGGLQAQRAGRPRWRRSSPLSSPRTGDE